MKDITNERLAAALEYVEKRKQMEQWADELDDFLKQSHPGDFSKKIVDMSPDAMMCRMEKASEDPVHHPSHYCGEIEVIDFIRDKLTKEEFQGYCKGNTLKYIARHGKKETEWPAEDLEKAKVYLGWLIESIGEK